jgi:23S rRNA pseudouridine2605 synthase
MKKMTTTPKTTPVATDDQAPPGEKLQKVLARAGLGSRRELEAAIAAGRAEVNGLPAMLGDRVQPTDRLVFDGRPVESSAPQRMVLIYNKPEGEVCTRDDPENRPTVFARLPVLKEGRWLSVGRLDINTSGLLLFTTDGELANRLMHPSYHIEREYAVRVLGEVTPEMVAQMHEGVQLEDGMARFTDIQCFGGSGANVWYHVVIMEGRQREVRRLWESQGVVVSRLKRVRYGNVFLDADLKMGQWKALDQKVIDALAASVDLPSVKVPVLAHKEREQWERKQRKKAPPRSPVRLNTKSSKVSSTRRQRRP